MKKWMVQSRENYKHVNKPRRLPTRALRVNKDSQEVILCHTGDQYAEYAALSHCWGSSRPFMLTSDNLHSLRSGIPTTVLPKSFQDALWLTSQLQIPYLWIDSLCILQDDPNDWIHESSRMSEVYGNASLTIAACRAKDSSQGFLGPRTVYEKINLPFHVNGISSEVFACASPLKYVGESSRIIDLEDEPLSGRAWTLQERYLSPRILHFTRSQTYFEHGSCFLAEDGCTVRPPPSNPDAVISQYLIPKATPQCWRAWRKIVTRYSRRNLTFEGDKLPALGGLAARFAAESVGENGSSDPSDCYLAGLWRDDLIRGLCWDSEFPDLGPAGISQAPTWSWASTRSSIYYGTDWFDEMEDLAVVRDARVELETPGNMFGRVTGGRILMGVTRLRVHRRPDSPHLWCREDDKIFRIGTSWDGRKYLAPEAGRPAISTDGETEIFAVPLGWIKNNLTSPDSPDGLIGPFFIILVLDEDSLGLGQAPTFRRVASGFMVFKDQGELEDIIIV
ncbi:hypothetical protein CDV31_008036 [Fusarium ambrosium]|uniref:Heterokaryon incompatibility domain-containing protein n=1 Tax=Fusarium ambrosium TaxID=131363 RepID=A0A428U336_9HYPO|nr:hypothetical protein CDV31_008036 [Fusarium ambrosium]